MTPLRIDAGLAAGALAPGHRLHGILGAALRRRGPRAARTGAGRPPPWPAAHFGLDRVTRFRRAGPAARRQVLLGCAEDLLAEAYFVEKLGLAFTAKMLLLSETTEERQLYALFGADEAAHLAAVRPHVPERVRAGDPDDPFLRLLAEAIAEGSRATLTYLIQVVLEGWGLVHYQALARGCRDTAIRRVLRRLLKDEALHHGSGVALSRPRPLVGADRAHALHVLDRLGALVQAGPQRVVGRLESGTGPLGRRERSVVLAELDAPAHAAARMTVLARLAAVQPGVAGALTRGRTLAFRDPGGGRPAGSFTPPEEEETP